MITVQRDRIVTDPDGDSHICVQPPLAGLTANDPATVEQPPSDGDSPPVPLTASTTRSPTPEPGPTVTAPPDAEDTTSAVAAAQQDEVGSEEEQESEEEQGEEEKQETEPPEDFGRAIFAPKSTTGRMVVYSTPLKWFKFVAVRGRRLHKSEQMYECHDCKEIAHRLRWSTRREHHVGRIYVNVETERIVRFGPDLPSGEPHLCTQQDLLDLVKEAAGKKPSRRASSATSARDADGTDGRAASSSTVDSESSAQASGVGVGTAAIGGGSPAAIRDISSTPSHSDSPSVSASSTPQTQNMPLSSTPNVPVAPGDEAGESGPRQTIEEQPLIEPDPDPSSNGAHTASGARKLPVQTRSGRASLETDAHGAQLITCTTAGGVTLTFSVFHKPDDETLWAKCVQCLDNADYYRAVNDAAPQIGILIVEKGALKHDPLHPQGLPHICRIAGALPHGAPPLTNKPRQAAAPSQSTPLSQTSTPYQDDLPSHNAPPPQTSSTPCQSAPPSRGTLSQTGTPCQAAGPSQSQTTPPLRRVKSELDALRTDASAVAKCSKSAESSLKSPKRKVHRFPYSTLRRRRGRYRRTATSVKQEVVEQDAHKPADPPGPLELPGPVDPPGPSAGFGVVNILRLNGKRVFSYQSRRYANHKFTFVQTSTIGCIAEMPGATPLILARANRNRVGTVTVQCSTRKLLGDPDRPSGLDHICLIAASADTPPPGPSAQGNQLDSNQSASHEVLDREDHDYLASPNSRAFGADHDYAATPSTRALGADHDYAALPSMRTFGAPTASPSTGTFGAAAATPSTETFGAATASPSTQTFAEAAATPSAGTFGSVKYLDGFKKIAHRSEGREYRFKFLPGSTTIDRTSSSLIATRRYTCLACSAEAVVKGRYFVERDPATGHSCEPKLLAIPQAPRPQGRPTLIAIPQAPRPRGRPRKIREEQPKPAIGPAEQPSGSAAQDDPSDAAREATAPGSAFAATDTEQVASFGMAQFTDEDKRKFVYESRRYPGKTFTFVLSLFTTSKDYYYCRDCKNSSETQPPKVFVRKGEIIERDPDCPQGKEHACLRPQHPTAHRSLSAESSSSARSTPQADGKLKPASTTKRKLHAPTGVRYNLGAAGKGTKRSAATACGSSPFAVKREISTTMVNQRGASTAATPQCASPFSAPMAQSTPRPAENTIAPISPPALTPQPPNVLPNDAGPSMPLLPSVADQPPHMLSFGVAKPGADRSFYYESQYYIGHFFKFVWQLEHNNGLHVMRQYRCHDCLEVKQKRQLCETIHFIMTCDDRIVNRDPDSPLGVEHLCMRADIGRNATTSHHNPVRSIKQELLPGSNAGPSSSATGGLGAAHAVHVKQETTGGGVSGFQAGAAGTSARSVDPKRAYAFEKRAAESDTPVLKKPKGNTDNDQFVERDQDSVSNFCLQGFPTPGPSTSASTAATPGTSARADVDAPTTSSTHAPQSIPGGRISGLKIRMITVNRRSQ
ncbi:hypothetical protein AAVH_15771 [Aphelenchoides avenae]|nr:hypothetical protein AAVH_15771 [Aphelenchus avenae]